jgi:inhibitor of KinA sporulation pathway (predicted exonuclease)
MANFLSLDLELNQPSDKIIQIGAVVGDIHSGEIFEKFDRLVKIDEPLCLDEKICNIPKLTGITDEMLEKDGISLIDAYTDLAALHKKYQCFRNPIVWGGGDSKSLKEDLARLGHHFSSGFGVDKHLPMYCFGHRWLDVKSIYQVYCLMNNLPVQGGLAKSMTRLGLKFDGTKHNAMWDAYNTFLIAKEMFGKLKTYKVPTPEELIKVAEEKVRKEKEDGCARD